MLVLEYIVDGYTAEKVLSTIAESQDKTLGSDTETTGLDPHTSRVRLVQIANGGVVYVFDLFKIGQELFASMFSRFLSNVKGRKAFVFHNFKFDVKMLWSIGIDLTGHLIFDTMLAVKVLECGLSLSATLKEVMFRYLNITLDKTEQKSDWSVPELSESQLRYAAKDTLKLKVLAHELKRDLQAASLMDTFKLEMRAVFGFAMMEYYGVKLDLDRLRQVQPYYEKSLIEAKNTFLDFVPIRFVRKSILGDIIDEGVEPTSSSQVLKVLQDLEIPNPVYNPDSKDDNERSSIIPSTGAPLLKMVDVNDYPIVGALLEHRKASKILSSYIYNLPDLINPVTGRLHTDFNQIVSTGRSSSTGPNLNQLPRPSGKEPLDEAGVPLSIRSCFLADTDYKFALADFSQIELRVMASVCRDANMLDEFLGQKDPYSSTASFLSGIPYEELVVINLNGEDKVKPEYKKLRQNAKAVRLGLNYGMWWKKLRNYAKQQYGVSMTQEEAKANYDRYFTAYPGLKSYHNTFNDPGLLEARTMYPFFRRRLWEAYPGVPGLCNLPIQGTSGDIQKLAIANIYEELARNGFGPTKDESVRLVLTIHDELEIEALEPHAEFARELLERNMVEAGQFVIKDCPILADAAIVNNLAEKE